MKEPKKILPYYLIGTQTNDGRNTPSPRSSSKKTIDFSQDEKHFAKTSTLGSTTSTTKPSNKAINTQTKTSSDYSSTFGSSFEATSGTSIGTSMTTVGTSSATNLENEDIEAQKSTPFAAGRSTIKEYTSSLAARSAESDIETTTLPYETTGEGIIVFSFMQRVENLCFFNFKC